VTADITQLEPARLALSGVLDYQSGPALREAGAKLIRKVEGTQVHLDCAGVQRSSSVGLSLLLCFMRDAHACGKQLLITGMPEEMRQIVGVSGLDEILASGN
jgi:phospholipid transport system transporter-binding protein